MKKILAIDIGGTKILHGIVSVQGEILSEVKKTLTPCGMPELEDHLKKIISIHENEVCCIAFAAAGTVNKDNTRIVSAAHNMPDGYCNTDFSELSSKPVFVENDANAAAWAEYKTGAALGCGNSVIITLGTGIGGGFIVDGRLMRGKSGRAGEIGSMKINGRGRTCICGQKDCWESYASGTGLKLTAEEIANQDDIFKCSMFKDKKSTDITTYDIIEGLKKGDEYSLKVFNIWKQDLITGLIGAADIFDMESIVISGGMGGFINTREIENAVNAEIKAAPVEIKLAKAGNYAGMIGAAILAGEKYG